MDQGTGKTGSLLKNSHLNIIWISCILNCIGSDFWIDPLIVASTVCTIENVLDISGEI